jgi:hypothetical protein
MDEVTIPQMHQIELVRTLPINAEVWRSIAKDPSAKIKVSPCVRVDMPHKATLKSGSYEDRRRSPVDLPARRLY